MAKKNYDSEFCGSLPLNHINVIQSYGYLLILHKESFEIIQFSENVVELIEKSPEDINGSLLSDYTDLEQLITLRESFGDNSKVKIPLTFTFRHKNFQSLAHFKTDYIILEVEKAELQTERSFTNVYSNVKYAVAAIESASTIAEVSNVAIHELRKITGFDSIMMYRFDENWNGTVIAQEKVDGLDDYMGHTFPGSDIPRQARELYLKNPYRLIPDREYRAARLYPVVNPVTNAFIDLTDCNLRGVAAVHLEYLKNMNVKASMSIRVIKNDKLWGLIACHHILPHYINFEIGSVCEMISAVISSRISAILNKTKAEIESNLNNQQSELIAQIYTHDDIIKGLLDPDATNLQKLFSASGIVSNFRNDFQYIGEVPDKYMVENLCLWLQNKGDMKIFHTDHLPELFEEAVPYPHLASGILAIPLDFEKGEYLIAFRPEVVQTINWGGNPNQTINFDPDGKKYHPRASFKIWKQQVNNTSDRWTEQEITVAENLRTFLFEFNTKKSKA